MLLSEGEVDPTSFVGGGETNAMVLVDRELRGFLYSRRVDKRGRHLMGLIGG